KGYRLRLLDLASGKELRQFELSKSPGRGFSHTEMARCAAFSADGKLLAVGELSKRVHVWEPSTGREIYFAPAFRNSIECLAFSPNGKTLAVGAWQRVLVGEASTGKDLLRRGGHANQVSHVAFSPDGKTVATQSSDALIIWDLLTGQERQKWTDKRLIGFSPEGDFLLREKGSIVQWQPATGKTIRTFKVYQREVADDIGKITSVFSRDGKTMVTDSRDRTIRLWNQQTGEKVWEARRTNKGVRFPADIGGHWPIGFTHDGKAVVSSADDAVIRFWDAETGKELRWFRTDSSEAVLSP